MDFEPTRKAVISGAEIPADIGPEAGEEGPFGTAQMTAYETQTMEAKVDAQVPGVVVFSELYYPGWQAAVDGKPAKIVRADAALRGVFVPAGNHTVTLTAKISHQTMLITFYVLGLALFVAALGYQTYAFLTHKKTCEEQI